MPTTMPFAVLRRVATLAVAALASLAFAPAVPAAQYAYLISGGAPHTIAIVDIESRAVVSGPVTVRDFHTRAALSPDGNRLYAVSREGSSSATGFLTVIATSGGAVVTTFAVGRDPTDVVASPDGNRVYVANSSDRTLIVVNTTTFQQSTITLPICISRLAISPDSRYVYAACGGDLVTVDTQTGTTTPARRILTAEFIADMVIHPDGAGLWVLGNNNAGKSKLAAVYTSTLAVAWSLDFNQWPRAVAVNPDGRSVYVALATIAPTGELVSINTESHTVRASLPMPDGPRALGISQDGRDAYVATFLGPVANVDLGVGSIAGQLNGDASIEDIVVGPGPLQNTTRRTIVEFYHDKLDHYFITGYQNEIDDLDSGVHKGWKRTGLTFDAFEPGRARGHGGPVCRFYGKPSAGLDSHFYSGHRSECDAVSRRFVDSWQLEGLRVFDATLPNLVTGQCPLGTKPVYRLWNRRSDSNHRYTTDRAVWSAMKDQDFQPEGYGNDGVALCAVDTPGPSTP